MSLKGNLSSVNLTEIFQMLSLSGREGTLFIYEGVRKRAICFNREGVSIRSRERNEAALIGKILVRLGRIEEHHLQSALESRRSSERLFGDVLVQMGACTEQDVEEGLRLQTQEEIQELFLNRSDAQFEYIDGYFPETEIPFVNLNVNSLLIEIARRTDEWEYIRRRIRGPREIYRFTGVEGEVDAELLQECYAHRIDPLIDGSHSVGEIIEFSYVNKYEVCKLMAAYLDAGVIELVPAEAIRQNARLALRMGDSESAIRHYEYLMGTGDFPLDILGEAAEAHEANRDFPEAAALLRRLAEELVRQGDYRGAIDVLRRVANYPRPEPDAIRYLLELVFENPRAAAEFSANVVEAGKTLVAFYIGQNQEGEALDLLQRLIKTFPDEVAFAVSLVNVHYENDDRERAAMECERLANSFLKRKRPAHAVSLYKKLLVIDPERQDIREKIRKLVSGRRRRPGRSTLPRVAAVLGVTLLLGGVGLVLFQNNVKTGTGTTNPDKVDDWVRTLFARAVEEKQSAMQSGRRSIEEFNRLVAEVQGDPLERKEELRKREREAADHFRLFQDTAEKAVQIAETIRKQNSRADIHARVRALLDPLEEVTTQVENAQRLWQVEAQRAAERLREIGEDNYQSRALLRALERFELARELATNPEFRDDAKLQQYIANIRHDQSKVAREKKRAKQKEEENDWTGARRVYLDLIREFGDADLVQDIRMPVELLTVPQGAAIVLDGVEYSRPTPAIVRVNPHKQTAVQLRKEGFRTQLHQLPPVDEQTDAARYQLLFTLQKESTWTRTLRGERFESSPAVLADRVVAVTRSGDWQVLDAVTGRVKGGGGLETVDVTAGLATDGRLVIVPTLDGRAIAIDAVAAQVEYTFRGTTKTPLRAVYATPAVAGSIFYIADVAGNVFAFDARSRSVVWSAETPYGVRATPVLQGPDVVVVSTTGAVTVLRREDGVEVARYALHGAFRCAPAAVGDDLLVFASADGEVFGVERRSGVVRWEKAFEKLVVRETPPVVGRSVYLSPEPGHLVTINSDTGGHFDSRGSRTAAQGRVPLAANRIFFVHGRTLAAYGPRQDGYGLAWTFESGAPILAGPVVRDGAVYIGDSRGDLHRLEVNE